MCCQCIHVWMVCGPGYPIYNQVFNFCTTVFHWKPAVKFHISPCGIFKKWGNTSVQIIKIISFWLSCFFWFHSAPVLFHSPQLPVQHLHLGACLHQTNAESAWVLCFQSRMKLWDMGFRPNAFSAILCTVAPSLIPLLQSPAPSICNACPQLPELLGRGVCSPKCQGRQRGTISYSMEDGSQKRKPRCYQWLSGVYESWQKIRSA